MLIEYSEDKEPFLAPFDELPLKRNAATSVVENNVSGTVLEMVSSNF